MLHALTRNLHQQGTRIFFLMHHSVRACGIVRWRAVAMLCLSLCSHEHLEGLGAHRLRGVLHGAVRPVVDVALIALELRLSTLGPALREQGRRPPALSTAVNTVAVALAGGLAHMCVGWRRLKAAALWRQRFVLFRGR